MKAAELDKMATTVTLSPRMTRTNKVQEAVPPDIPVRLPLLEGNCSDNINVHIYVCAY